MKKQNYIIAVAVIFLLCLSLTACGNNQAPAETNALLFESEELGFSAELPALLQDCLTTEITELDAYGETIRTAHIYYNGEEETVEVLSFDEMSVAVWEQVVAEGGPVGTELGRSETDRVVVLNTLQSNPFAEGTNAFQVLQALPEQLTVISETFQFLK